MKIVVPTSSWGQPVNGVVVFHHNDTCLSADRCFCLPHLGSASWCAALPTSSSPTTTGHITTMKPYLQSSSGYLRRACLHLRLRFVENLYTDNARASFVRHDRLYLAHGLSGCAVEIVEHQITPSPDADEVGEGWQSLHPRTNDKRKKAATRDGSALGST